MVNPADWFVRYQRRPAEAPLRLFTFPYAGGGAAIYRTWGDRLRGVDVYSVLLPGRERRLREPPIGDLPLLLEALLPAFKALADRPFILFGHSMGALIAYELANRLREWALDPEHLIVSACRAPERPRREQALHALPDRQLVTALRDYGGTPPVVLDHQEIVEMLLPMIRADFRLHETYRFVPCTPLNCPVTAIAGQYDRLVVEEEKVGWGNHTFGVFALNVISGNHFFITDCADTVLGLVQRCIDDVRISKFSPDYS